MKPIVFLSTVALIFSSCIRDYSSTTSSVIKNETAHTIQINPYLNGVIDNSMSYFINPNSEITPINLSMVRGKSLGSALGRLLQPFDSVVVVFDGFKSSKHNRFTDSSNCNNCILQSNQRSIANENNWVKTVTREDKHTLTGYYTFTFIEQDFIDAK